MEGWLAEADLVLTEGFRRSGLPMIRVHRSGADDPTWQGPEAPIAWVSDATVQVDVPLLPLNDPEAVADWVVARFLPQAEVAPCTLVLPVGRQADLDSLVPTAARLGPLAQDVLVVHAPKIRPPQGLAAAPDLLPGIGPLGGLLTGLMVAKTANVRYLGARHHDVGEAALHMLLTRAPRADVVVPTDGAHPEPLLARYGHRCLGAIKAAQLSGELRMDSWWGQVRVHRIPTRDED